MTNDKSTFPPPVAILAGGLGTRLGPLTRALPKALVDVGGRPFIRHQLELLARRGLRRVVLCLGHRGDMIRDAVGDGAGLEVDFSDDGPALRGTGGAVARALPLLGERFFVLYGDSYLDIDYLDVARRFERSRGEGLMTVFENAGRYEPSNVRVEGGAIVHYDKRRPHPEARHIDYGLSLFKRSAFRTFPENEAYDLGEVFSSLIARRQLAPYPVAERFLEIGSPEGLETVRRTLSAATASMERKMSYSETYLSEVRDIAAMLDAASIERMVRLIADARDRGGRLFFVGVGGSAGNASHAVNDFRKIAGIESYSPADNVSELTARVNDDGWDTVYDSWLKTSRLSVKDLVFVLSVGGGDAARNISPNIVRALDYAKAQGATICGVVGRDGGHTARVADACVIVPTVNAATVTAHAESFQSHVLHLIVTHPAVRAAEMKWESVR